MPSTTRRLGAALAALPLSLTLIACGGDTEAADKPSAPTWSAQEITLEGVTLDVPKEWVSNTGNVGDVETVFANTPAGEEPVVALIADVRESYKESLDEYADEAMTWDEELKKRNADVTVDGVKFFHVSQKADEKANLEAKEHYGAIVGDKVYKFDFTLGSADQAELVEEIVSTVDFD